MRKWFRSFYSSGLFIPFILLLPYMCTIALNGADKALLLHSPGWRIYSADVDGTDERGLCGGSGESSGGDCKVGGVQAAGGGESEGEILDEVSESIAGKTGKEELSK